MYYEAIILSMVFNPHVNSFGVMETMGDHGSKQYAFKGNIYCHVQKGS